ncbi:MAG: hypothetical protein HQL23_08685, partial [Candidatus Omnitrophica bacterium]|nr:hypothetical protein [Candidatus Omnitrophota bacterium]
MATLYAKTGCFPEAEKFFRQVIYLDPDVPMAHFHLANIYTAAKKNAKAGLEFKNALRLLENKNLDEPVKFSEDFTTGLLKKACQHNLPPPPPRLKRPLPFARRAKRAAKSRGGMGARTKED